MTKTANELDEIVAVRPGGTLYVNLDRGAVAVSSHDADHVRIDARARGWAAWSVDFDLERDGNDVRLTGEALGWGFWPFGGARVKVQAWVPREYSVDVQTRGGRVQLADLTGHIVAETSGGSVDLNGATGPVDLRTSGGSIHVERVKGNLDAETSGGGISIAGVSGDVQARTSGGAVRIDRVTGQLGARTSGGRIDIHDAAGQVDASTSGGGISVSFAGPPAGIIETSGGSIEVHFPETAGADLDALTTGGRVDVAPQLSVHGEVDPHHVVGAINGGGAPLRVRTTGGSISVRTP